MRGLGQGFTQVLVNGRPIPGAGNDRTVFVDRIPAEIVDRIEVIRSPSADIDSQGIGGTINIILKDGASLPPGVIARVGVTNSIDAGESRGNGAVSWSGRNKDDTVFFSLTLDAQERYNNKDVTEGVFESDSVGFDEEVARRGDGRRLAHFDNPAASSAVERTEEQDSRDSRDVSFNGDVTWLISDDTSLRVDAFALTTKRKEHQDTRVYEGDGSVGGLDMDNPELEFQDADFRQDSFGVSTLFKTYLNPSTQLDLEASYNSFTDEGIEDTFEETSDNLVNREDNDADDVEWSVAASITRQMNGVADAIGIDGAELKVGLVAKSKDRDYSPVIGDGLDEDDNTTNAGRLRYTDRRPAGPANGTWEGNREDNDADDVEWSVAASITRQMNGVADAIGSDGAELKVGLVAKSKDRDYSLVIGDGLDDDDYTTNDGRFSYKERRLDGYALVKWEVNDALNVETGVRAENTRTEQRYSSDFLEGGVLQDTVSGQAENDAFMLNPSAHVQWKVSDADQLRFSVARTVRRPSIDQLIPAF